VEFFVARGVPGRGAVLNMKRSKNAVQTALFLAFTGKELLARRGSRLGRKGADYVLAVKEKAKGLYKVNADVRKNRCPIDQKAITHNNYFT
jgi:hypothetical protein